jgi:hypothetical protein
VLCLSAGFCLLFFWSELIGPTMLSKNWFRFSSLFARDWFANVLLIREGVEPCSKLLTKGVWCFC